MLFAVALHRTDYKYIVGLRLITALFSKEKKVFFPW